MFREWNVETEIPKMFTELRKLVDTPHPLAAQEPIDEAKLDKQIYQFILTETKVIERIAGSKQVPLNYVDPK